MNKILGINIDHIAVLREARRVNNPNLIDSLSIVKFAGAEQITIHLREDRRHIQDKDVVDIIKHSQLPINVEVALSDEVLDFILIQKPHKITIVPEKREEVTTEGGLDIFKYSKKISEITKIFQDNDIEVSLFIDPIDKNIEKSKELGVDWIEFHTGEYANIYAMLYENLSKTNHSIKKFELSRAVLRKKLDFEIKNLENVCKKAYELNINIAIGHGLNYQNIKYISNIPHIQEFNIGQSIIANSIFNGLEKSIIDMKKLIK